jgi:branched-chain amino acid transport system permease protein
VVLLIGFAIGAVTQLVLIRPLAGKSELNPVIVTIGLLVVFEGLVGAIYGNASRGFPAAFSQRGLHVGHTTIAFSYFDAFILASVLALMTAMLVLFRFTTLGLRMRASAFSREISRLLGVRVGLLLTLGWGLAGIAGSLAGLLVAPISSFGPYYMDLILVYAFTAAVIGGLESPVGALIGGLISGLCISYVGGYLGSGLEPLGALVLLMVALMARPEGIFARPPARRV